MNTGGSARSPVTGYVVTRNGKEWSGVKSRANAEHLTDGCRRGVYTWASLGESNGDVAWDVAEVEGTPERLGSRTTEDLHILVPAGSRVERRVILEGGGFSTSPDWGTIQGTVTPDVNGKHAGICQVHVAWDRTAVHHDSGKDAVSWETFSPSSRESALYVTSIPLAGADKSRIGAEDDEEGKR